ncbi:hypothetical protein Lfu02_13430 [Longispora fulva]|uniref:Uncharacterized protein n=1 Tax=Longispora fulva TaxID=619741 RepID=A0A8J7GW75_9ACTN|nr:hypothetical protein [Longispora fulva]MBG6140645.1 hypothetical protein [Longispora fulva]GIG56971.1 hypothetical protein Lfu02_13430 [Longispora fulva]
MSDGELGKLEYEAWADGTAVVFLHPLSGDRSAPPIPLDPEIRRTIKGMFRVGLVLTALAVTALVVGIRLIADGSVTSGIVTGVVAVLLLFLGLIMLAMRLSARFHRGEHVLLSRAAAAAFTLAFLEERRALDPDPDPAVIEAGRERLWALAVELSRRPGPADGIPPSGDTADPG